MSKKVTRVKDDHVVKASVKASAKAFVRWSSDRSSDVPQASFLPSRVCPIPPVPLCFSCSGHVPSRRTKCGSLREQK